MPDNFTQTEEGMKEAREIINNLVGLLDRAKRCVQELEARNDGLMVKNNRLASENAVLRLDLKRAEILPSRRNDLIQRIFTELTVAARSGSKSLESKVQEMKQVWWEWQQLEDED
jgi:hypothetical protein